MKKQICIPLNGYKKKVTVYRKLEKTKCLNGKKPVIKIPSKSTVNLCVSQSSGEKVKKIANEAKVDNRTVEGNKIEEQEMNKNEAVLMDNVVEENVFRIVKTSKKGNSKIDIVSIDDSKKIMFNNRKELFYKITKENLTKFNIPPTPTILKSLEQFFTQKLSKLDFLNEQMIEIYSRVFLYRIGSKFIGVKLAKTTLFSGPFKKELFRRALDEVNDWTMQEEINHNEDESICNLYKIAN
ncbi:uncharacterized protein VICG_01980 [Vittaforma corneae ATCC 50505]|uniref:Uncharacterized protein n=1 Tax=Vittaforma corneae (strain ATCC 50505) TaxID=993615 RepID=L2GKB3_VITCO|nr:uncharacterized protein VICG_01980 [Vittaforma corneae ATCC 50505]ELA40950.1 hypothetical protein VICG_01980 [Vittaforma corneae ATCC 50505]